jgi:hypothetical protein
MAADSHANVGDWRFASFRGDAAALLLSERGEHSAVGKCGIGFCQ